MNDIKPGWKTTEFWASLVVALAAPVIGVLVARGVLSQDESSLVIDLVGAMAPVVGLVVSGYITHRYTDGRSKLKRSQIENSFASDWGGLDVDGANVTLDIDEDDIAVG